MWRLNHDAGLSSQPSSGDHDVRFYTGQHRFYCGVDLHTRTLSLCVLDSAGGIAVEATLPPEPDRLLDVLAPYRDGLVFGSECMSPEFQPEGLTFYSPGQSEAPPWVHAPPSHILQAL
jgi:hypothetical protein